MKKIRKLIKALQENSIPYLLKVSLKKLIRPRIKEFELFKELFQNRSGLEIGGPSGIFKQGGFIPLYKIVKNLDGCNFSNTTLWEGNIENLGSYKYSHGKMGKQYVSEASNLSQIDASKYDFIISSNCLEHVANPIKALLEWVRVLKKDGVILLVLPNRKFNFDHKRPITTFDHLLKDFDDNIEEDDMTHLEEILQLHDLNLDFRAGTKEQFTERSKRNVENRALHHHVFNTTLLNQLFTHLNLQVLMTYENEEFIILGRKLVE